MGRLDLADWLHRHHIVGLLNMEGCWGDRAALHVDGYLEDKVGFLADMVGFLEERIGFQEDKVGFLVDMVGFLGEKVDFL